jgi:hypothetical protein
VRCVAAITHGDAKPMHQLRKSTCGNPGQQTQESFMRGLRSSNGWLMPTQFDSFVERNPKAVHCSAAHSA